MSESMIERVARAIARTQSGTLFREECTAVQLDAFGYVAAARAAIEAMREPTDVMINAGGEQGYGHTRENAEEWAKEEKFDSYAEEAVAYWRSMLDAALKEGS